MTSDEAPPRGPDQLPDDPPENPPDNPEKSPPDDPPDSGHATVHKSEEMLRGKNTPEAPPPASRGMIGRTVGNFTIKRLIGEGGMGAVYQAQQSEPRRVVALKMMRAGLTSRSALRRFHYEVQTLARLRHPGIAQIYEAGTTDTGEGGLPWFAMEYLEGAQSITRYAQNKSLSTREKLELFLKVCDAAHHGHQKGIIHRDLKPGNIMVTGQGNPKIIDFGVARSTDSDMAVTTLQTDVGALVGTMQYMSPEQCAADPYDIDVRSDVYALGVVLFELLVGKPPYDISSRAIHEAARIVREEPPTRPSTVDRLLRGDIETICLKALEKDRDRRYQSAHQLRQDIDLYLNDEPITARRPNLGYQLSLFYRRHRAASVLAVSMLIVLVVGVAALSWLATTQARALTEADRQSARSQAIIDGVTAMFSPADADQDTWPRDVTLETVLDRASGTLRTDYTVVESGEYAAVVSYFGLVLAHAYQTVGAFEKSRAQIDAALASLGAWYLDDHSIFFDAHMLGVTADFALGREEHALRTGRRIIEAKTAQLGPHSPDTLGAAYVVAETFVASGQADAAAELIEALIESMPLDNLLANQSALDALLLLAEIPTSKPSPGLKRIVDRIIEQGTPRLDTRRLALLNLIAWELGHAADQPDNALNVLERLGPSLTRLSPNHVQRRLNRIYRGQMLRMLARSDDARALFATQVDLDREDASISPTDRDIQVENLAGTLEQLGRLDQAARIREQLSEQSSSSP